MSFKKRTTMTYHVGVEKKVYQPCSPNYSHQMAKASAASSSISLNSPYQSFATAQANPPQVQAEENRMATRAKFTQPVISASMGQVAYVKQAPFVTSADAARRTSETPYFPPSFVLGEGFKVTDPGNGIVDREGSSGKARDNKYTPVYISRRQEAAASANELFAQLKVKCCSLDVCHLPRCATLLIFFLCLNDLQLQGNQVLLWDHRALLPHEPSARNGDKRQLADDYAWVCLSQSQPPPSGVIAERCGKRTTPQVGMMNDLR
jgi:hypothetical protein